MDFRTCPACNASVLEDDVQDCPFCGASMSGKGGGKPKAKPAAAKAAPAKPAAAEKTPPPKPAPAARKPSPRRPIGETTADEENPFEVDTAAVRRAIPVAPRPTKTRTHQVVCPMCETPGFISPGDAGKDVKCCSPECMVPIFKSPAIEKQEQVEEEPTSWFTPAKLAVIVIVLIGAGIGAFFMFGTEQPEPVANVPLQPAVQPTGPDKDELVQQAVEKEAKPLTLDEIRRHALIEVDKEAASRNRSRTTGYLLASEIHAAGGDLQGAGDLLARLRREARSADFLQIQPLVQIALQHLAQGNRTEAGKHADTALALAERLPNVDRQSLDSAASAAALLVQLDRVDQARAVIRRHSDAGPRGLASLLWTTAIEGNTFNLDAEAARPYHVAVASPLWVCVTEVLVHRGASAAALELCGDAPDEDARDNCLAAWAGASAGSSATSPVDGEPAIAQAIGSDRFNATAKARAWAAVAHRQASAGDVAAATKSLEQAEAAAELIAAFPPVPMPSMKEIYASRGKHHAGLPDPAPARSAVRAFASIGLTHAQLGNPAAAWDSIAKALEVARGMAPTLTQTQQKVKEADGQKLFVEDELVRLLKIKANDGPARFRAFNDYRGQVHKLHDDEATPRFHLEVDILRAAIDAGLLQQVWDFVEQGSGQADLALNQPYFDSDLPGYIKVKAHLAGKADLARQVDAAFSGKTVTIHPVDEILGNASGWIAKGDLSKAGDLLGQAARSPRLKNHSDRFDTAVLQLCAALQEKHPAVKVMNEFILELRSPVMKENALRLLAGRSMQTGQAPQLWAAISKHVKLDPTEKAALYRGFMDAEPLPSSAAAQPPSTAAVHSPEGSSQTLPPPAEGR